MCPRGGEDTGKCLTKLSEEQKLELCARRAEGVSYNNLAIWIKTSSDAYADRGIVSKWFNSEEGKDLVEIHRKAALALMEQEQVELNAHRELWAKERLTKVVDRVHVLIKETNRLSAKLWSFPDEQVGSPEYLPVSREWRAYLELIGKEMKPLEMEAPAAITDPKSYFKQVFEEHEKLLEDAKNIQERGAQ